MNGCTRSLASNNIARQVKTARTPHLHIMVVHPEENCFTLESNQMFVISEYAFQWRTQEFCSGWGGSTNSVEDRGQREWGSGGW